MKTKSLLRFTKQIVSFLTVFLWAVLSVNAQCPTISDPTPPPICDASGFTFNDLNAYATDQGNGIVWYDSASGGTAYNTSQLVLEGTYYADDNSGICGARASVTIDFQVDASGQVLDRIYCTNDNATIQDYIDDVLQSSIPPGGSVLVFNDFDLTNQASPTDGIPTGASNYYIVFVDSGACESQQEIGQVGVFTAPSDPTPSTPQGFCTDANPTIGDLNPGTAVTNYNWYANLDGSGDPIPPALSFSTPLVDGNTYYIQIDDVFCVSNPVAVTVNIDDPYDPGTPGDDEFCTDNISNPQFEDLFLLLGGTPDTNGTWTGPITITNGNTGTIDVSQLPIGDSTFTYTVPANGECPENSTAVIISIRLTPESGTAVNPLPSFCEGTAPSSFDLYSLIDGENGTGTWTNVNTATTVPDPTNVDLSILTPNTYDFIFDIDDVDSCDDVDVPVSITIHPLPNTGTANNLPALCENDALLTNTSYDLFTRLTGTVDAGGTWTDDDNRSALVSANEVDLSVLPIGTSNFTYSITDGNSCTSSTTVTFTIEQAPESGTAVNPLPSFCVGAAPSSFDLYSLIDGESGTGTWTNVNTSTTVPDPTNVDLSILTANTYNFVFDIDAIGSCDDVDVPVSITIHPLPNTGTANNLPPLCENDALLTNTSYDLFTRLTGTVDAGGTWTDDDNRSALVSANEIDLSVLPIGTSNFTYSITDGNSCTNSTTVTFTIEPAPESGAPVASFPEFCIAEITTGQTVDLFDLLVGEDQLGIWNDDLGSGMLSGNTVTIDGLAAGTYNFTYDVNAIGSCDDIDITVSITINDTPAPTATTPQDFCDTATIVNLVATGTDIQWYDAATGGNLLSGTDALADGVIYYATQTDTGGTGCESSVRTAVTARIYQSPNSGGLAATPISECNNTTIDLNLGLDGTQDNTGTWYEGTDNTGTVVASPTTYDINGFTAGTYDFTYYVTATSPCVDTSTTITVTVDEPLSSGTSSGDQSFCSSDPDFDLDSNLTGASPGGEWTYNSDPTPISNMFDPSTLQSGTYTYTTSNSCGSLSTSFDIAVTLAPNAGAPATVPICVVDGVTDLFPFLGSGAQSGGTWSPALTSGTGEFDPNVDAAGDYTYTVLATGACTVNASATITVVVNDIVAPAMVDPNPEFCLIDNPMVSDLNNTITVTGTITWYEDAALTTVANTTDALVDGEDYYATQTDTATGCESSTSTTAITVTINDAPIPVQTNPNQELCINDGPTINDLTSNINYDTSLNTIAWYDSASGGTAILSSEALSNGITYYAALVDIATGCESSVRLAVTPDLTACGILQLPDGFSPNGDGVNDTFNVDNLDILYPNFEMEIYNRYGNIVYKGNANTPRFNGKSNQSGTLGNGDLPVGVYFYIFNFNDGVNKPEQGRLYLSR